MQEHRRRMMMAELGADTSTDQTHEKESSIYREDEELQELGRLGLMLLDEKTPLRVDAEFEEAVIKLREFMKEHITMGEIYKAQKGFQERFIP